jgi:uncharacterized phage protein gp47/JayE
MPTEFQRPTLAELIARVQADLESEVTGITARLRRRFERAAAVATAIVGHGLHGHLAWVAEQIFPDTAVERFLLRWAAVFGLTRKAAVRATGFVSVTGTGGDMPAGTQWVRPADGRLYETLTDADDITTAVDVQLRAVEGGIDGNVDAGEELTLVNPVADVDGTAVVDEDGIDGGADLETLEALLERLLHRIQDPPKGGAPGDFETWALEVAGVTRAWEYVGVDGTGNPGIGKVALAFVRDGDEDIIPDGDALQEVQDYLDDRFFGDEVIVFAPTEAPLTVTITLTPNTSAVQTAVKAEIADMISRDAEPGGTILLSRIREAISAATGETDHVLLAPTADVEHDFGEMATYDASLVTFP